MKNILASLAFGAVSALGLAPQAEAAPFSPAGSALVVGHGTWGVGVGVGGGGGYGPVYDRPAYSGGYYRTEIRTVPVTVLAGYDVYRRPVYTTQYVQQAYQVWVPYAPVYYAPTYAPRPAVSWGVGVGYRWR